MDKIISAIKKEIIKLSEIYKEESPDSYDFWNEHIKYVYEESIRLAQKYHADITIVEIGALLHDIALIKKIGTKADHHTNGAILAEELLNNYDITNNQRERIIKCVLNHRSSQNAASIEELCVADADILAHFDNILMLFQVAFKNNNNLPDIRQWLKKSLEKDYNDLSEKTKEEYQERYHIIKEVLFDKEIV